MTKWVTIKLRGEVISQVDRRILLARDEFDLPVYRSRAELVMRAVNEFLNKRNDDNKADRLGASEAPNQLLSDGSPAGTTQQEGPRQ